MTPADSDQPMSAKSYALIALVGLGIAVGLLVFYIAEVPRLVQTGTGDKVFYLLLIPWGLASAAFLFGAMRSYARLTGNPFGNAIELGGPVVLFCLVVVGGFKLVPPAQDPTFDLTVRVHGEDSPSPMIDNGKITLELDTVRRLESIDAAGEANFKGVPVAYRASTLRILPQVDGYVSEWQSVKLEGKALDLSLVKEAAPIVTFNGSIYPAPENPDAVKVLVDGQSEMASPDEFGRFSLKVSGRNGDRVRVKVFVSKQLEYDDFEQLPGPATLKLHAIK
jgi:hypothetical protein